MDMSTACIVVHVNLLKLCVFTNSHNPALCISGINNLWNLGLLVYILGLQCIIFPDTNGTY